jgi:para-aminobenzoate synthetase/4-amino-4-deoxychorismate lyase
MLDSPHDGPACDRFRPYRVALPGTVRSGHEALLVRGEERPFALVGRWAGSRALVGSQPVWSAPPSADPLALLAHGRAAARAPKGFVGGGWFGYLGFALTRTLESHGAPSSTLRGLPPFVLSWYDHVLRCDDAGQWWFEALWTAERAAALGARLSVLSERLQNGVAEPAPVATSPWIAKPSPGGHERAIAACRARIAAGDLYQANIALRLQATLSGDPIDLFSRAAAMLAPDRAGYLQGTWGALASLSPELFLERHGDRVRSAPIKGTCHRPSDPDRARAAREALERSEKDRAENVMIVDLVRNDLGRVCAAGTVEVTRLAQARPAPGVWHLVSEVIGELRPEVDDAALLRATFPPGSVTGAPKLAAVDVIHELESSAREVFTGAIGFASPCAGLELSVAIRTFEINGSHVWLDVGGAITADSDPRAETVEALDKARPLIDAIGAEMAPESNPGSAPALLRLGPRPVHRPDPAAGLLETILVRDGSPVALDLHLRRLSSSMRSLFDLEPPRTIGTETLEAARELGEGRVRLLVRPDGTVEVEVGAIPPDAMPAELAPVTLAGGIGAHKWLDRRLLEELSDAVAPATALFVDLDGMILETARASILLVDDQERIVVPPLDGRILPGVTRARALARASAAGIPICRRPIALDELSNFREVLLASALRGVRAVGQPGRIAALLAELDEPAATSVQLPR